jgi:hypothetical protein
MLCVLEKERAADLATMLHQAYAVARTHGLRFSIPAINHLVIRPLALRAFSSKQHSKDANELEKPASDVAQHTSSGYQLSQPADVADAQTVRTVHSASPSWLSGYRLEQPAVVISAPSVKKLDLEVHLKSEQFDSSVTHNTEDFDNAIARHSEVLDEQLLQGSDAHDVYFKRSSERYDAHVAQRSAALDARDSE